MNKVLTTTIALLTLENRSRRGFVTVLIPPNVAATVFLPFQCNLKKNNLYNLLSTLTSQRFLLLFYFFSNLWLQINEKA